MREQQHNKMKFYVIVNSVRHNKMLRNETKDEENNNNNKIGSKTRFFYNMDFSFGKKATAEAEMRMMA